MIEIENIKKFMAGFLGGNLFDDFLMSEGKLSMNISYEFDGKILKEFYDTEEWKEMKQYPYVTWEGLFINILYDRQGLKCTSGVSRKTFVLDKTLEEAWDQEVKERFLTKYL